MAVLNDLKMSASSGNNALVLCNSNSAFLKTDKALWRNDTTTSESSDLKKFSRIRGGHHRERKCCVSGSQSFIIFSNTLPNVVQPVGVWVGSAVYWASSCAQNCLRFCTLLVWLLKWLHIFKAIVSMSTVGLSAPFSAALCKICAGQPIGSTGFSLQAIEKVVFFLLPTPKVYWCIVSTKRSYIFKLEHIFLKRRTDEVHYLLKCFTWHWPQIENSHSHSNLGAEKSDNQGKKFHFVGIRSIYRYRKWVFSKFW